MGCSGFARHYCRNHWLFSLPRGTKMFQFPRFPLLILCVQIRVIRHDSDRVSPFGNLWFKACLAAPQSLSQPTTSFIGNLCQGILYVRLSNFLRSRLCVMPTRFLARPENLPSLLVNRYVSNTTKLIICINNADCSLFFVTSLRFGPSTKTCDLR